MPTDPIIIIWASLLFTSLLTLGQIAVTPTQVTASAGTLTCMLTATGGVCKVNGATYTTFTPPLVSGADASGYSVWNGNAVHYSLSMHGSVVSWIVSVQPNGGSVTRKSGTFSFPSPVTPGPVDDHDGGLIVVRFRPDSTRARA